MVRGVGQQTVSPGAGKPVAAGRETGHTRLVAFGFAGCPVAAFRTVRIEGGVLVLPVAWSPVAIRSGGGGLVSNVFVLDSALPCPTAPARF
jgi:hypothetical protein